MHPAPGFENPDAFLQPDDRCPEVNDHRLLLNNQCLKGGDHGWRHSTERGRNITRRPTPVNGYRQDAPRAAIAGNVPRSGRDSCLV